MSSSCSAIPTESDFIWNRISKLALERLVAMFCAVLAVGHKKAICLSVVFPREGYSPLSPSKPVPFLNCIRIDFLSEPKGSTFSYTTTGRIYAYLYSESIVAFLLAMLSPDPSPAQSPDRRQNANPSQKHLICKAE